MKLVIENIEVKDIETKFGSSELITITSNGEKHSCFKKLWQEICLYNNMPNPEVGDTIEVEVERKGKFKNIKSPVQMTPQRHAPKQANNAESNIMRKLEDLEKKLDKLTYMLETLGK